jgi:hypothetical protein
MLALHYLKKTRCGGRLYNLGGDSNSQANQTQTTDTQDNRIAAATDSNNLNNSRGVIGGNVIINKTDNGAVTASFDFANKIAAGAANTMAASTASAQATVMSSLDAVKSAYADNTATLADAYKTSKAGEQKIMVAGALLIGAVVAIRALGKA